LCYSRMSSHHTLGCRWHITSSGVSTQSKAWSWFARFWPVMALSLERLSTSLPFRRNWEIVYTTWFFNIQLTAVWNLNREEVLVGSLQIVLT
jgi:hypothetical protein